MNFNNTIKLIKKGIQEEVFPCAAFAIGNKDEIFIQDYLGYRCLYPEKEILTKDTLFDMASLSKVISTTMITFKAIEKGKLCLDDKLEYFFSDCYDKGEITIKDLLTHTSGITSHIPLWTKNITPQKAVDTILKTQFEYKTKTQTVYSCMGYIILAKILEIVFNAPLDTLARKFVFEPLNMRTATYNPVRDNVVSTEFSTDINGYLKGTVHDENARFLGGVAGNAGVFCTLDDVIKFCTMLSNHGENFMSERMFNIATKNYTPDFSENRGLGFMVNGNANCFMGNLFSEGSFGHTGFTGTSICVDKLTGLYAILLTNRVHFGRENNKIIRFRKLFHNSIWENN